MAPLQNIQGQIKVKSWQGLLVFRIGELIDINELLDNGSMRFEDGCGKIILTFKIKDILEGIDRNRRFVAIKPPIEVIFAAQVWVSSNAHPRGCCVKLD